MRFSDGSASFWDWRNRRPRAAAGLSAAGYNGADLTLRPPLPEW